MSPLTHFIGSWLVASVTTNNPRDRKLVTLAGVLPDLDGTGLVVDVARAVITGQPFTNQFYAQYHHWLLHGWPGAIVLCGLLTCFARQRLRTAALCLLAFHLHLACDLVGSRGPASADLWPIAYGEPFFRHPFWLWRGQWRLDGWQNRSITLVVFFTALWLASRRGYSFVEVFSRKLDAIFVGVLRKWNAALGRRFARKPG